MGNKVGVPKKIESPEVLWQLYQEYRQDILDNPIKLVKHVGKDAIEVEVKHYKPPIWKGFEAYLFRRKIIGDLEHYRYNKEGRYAEFVGIVRAISADMFDRKFAGASVGEYQHNIIARELGLVEKQEVQTFERPILEQGKELPGDGDLPPDELLD